MKKVKNVIVSVVTCLFSICLLMFGVYAASSPSVSVGGRVSYTARDAKVLVLGKVNGQAGEDQENKISYPSVADVTNPLEKEKVVSATQYLGFTKGTSAKDDNDDLAPWTMNATHEFYEDKDGIRSIVVSFKITNLSNYPIVSTVDFTGVADTDLASKNLARTTTGLKDGKVGLNKNETKEISVCYSVVNDALRVEGNDILNMSLTFEKTVLESAPIPVLELKSLQGSTMQSDWEYVWESENKSFTITKHIGDLSAYRGETHDILVVPSQVKCEDGKIYPVKALGTSGNEERIAELAELYYKEQLDDDQWQEIEDASLFRKDGEISRYDKTITISEGVETLYAGAIGGNLVNFPTSIKRVEALACHDNNITELNMANVRYVGKCAFMACQDLETVSNISSELVGLDYTTFHCCFALQNDNNLKDGAYYLGNETNEYLLLIGPPDRNIVTFENVDTQIVIAYAFADCTSLESVSLPNVTIAGAGILSGCTSLQSVNLPRAISIGDRAFANCTNLTDVTLASAKTIGEYAFNECRSLETIDIAMVETVGNYAFYGCSTLKNVTLRDLKTIGEGVFDYCSYLVDWSTQCGYIGYSENPYLVLLLLNTDPADCDKSLIKEGTKFILAVSIPT